MTIGLEQARELLKKAVETQGRDFVYNPGGRNVCAYRPLGPDNDGHLRLMENDPRTKTGCLVGTALTLAGETQHLHHSGSVRSLKDWHNDMMTEEAVHYFQVAQSAQDTGYTWGEAFDAAEHYAHAQSVALAEVVR